MERRSPGQHPGSALVVQRREGIDENGMTYGRSSAVTGRRPATMLVNQQLTHNRARTEARDYAVAKTLLDTYQFGRSGTVPAHLIWKKRIGSQATWLSVGRFHAESSARLKHRFRSSTVSPWRRGDAAKLRTDTQAGRNLAAEQTDRCHGQSCDLRSFRECTVNCASAVTTFKVDASYQ